jgi:hypothetical protein
MKILRDKEDDEWVITTHTNYGEMEMKKKKRKKKTKKKKKKKKRVNLLSLHSCGITWESITESLSQGVLPSTLYKELPREVYFTFKVYIFETKFILVQLKLMNPMKCWSPLFFLMTS